MIDAVLRFIDKTNRVAKAARQATYRAVDKAAFAIRKTAVASIQSTSGPSRPGTPPHTHTQRKTKKGKVIPGRLPKAIQYSSRRGVAVIGPSYRVIGESMQPHEFGGEYKGTDFPERPFMGPALEDNEGAFGASFEGTIGS